MVTKNQCGFSSKNRCVKSSKSSSKCKLNEKTKRCVFKKSNTKKSGKNSINKKSDKKDILPKHLRETDIDELIIKLQVNMDVSKKDLTYIREHLMKIKYDQKYKSQFYDDRYNPKKYIDLQQIF